jgi:tRNA(Ile2) C34 agmatinyltransferase TiaS
MVLIRLSSFRPKNEVLSSILNWVCPECGGRMGGRGREFKCQGKCEIDWRKFWERAL